MRAVRKTLDGMASGGIHDHLGGGFHRYSTDRYWVVPHFEKMLYDNALLARVYIEAYQVTGESAYLSTAKDTLGWILTEMTDEKGGFYSAQDADTVDGEGFYYTWTPKEIARILGEEGAKEFEETFGVSADGNFGKGRSILHTNGRSVTESSHSAGRGDDTTRRIEASMSKMLAARRRRALPSTDDKVLTSWNGLAISAFSVAYEVTGDSNYLTAGTRCASFLLEKLLVSGRLFRRYRKGDVAIEGTLEDYSFFSAALLDLYEATFDPTWLEHAIELSESMIQLFWDSDGGGFFMNKSQQTIARIKEDYDGPLPSGNSVAVMSLLRLFELTGKQDYKDKAERTLSVFADSIESAPSSHTAMLSALDFWFGSKEIVLTGPVEAEVFKEMLVEIRKRFMPTKVLALASGNQDLTNALTGGKFGLGGKPTAYVCENFACKTPVTSAEALGKLLNS
jgi:uncharacterized protein YyaL (SSP411 family)